MTHLPGDSMYSLFAIPPEIRHNNIECIVLSPSQAPDSISSALVSRQEPFQGWDYGQSLFQTWSGDPEGVRLALPRPGFRFISRATPLLLADKRRHSCSYFTIGKTNTIIRTGRYARERATPLAHMDFCSYVDTTSRTSPFGNLAWSVS